MRAMQPVLDEVTALRLKSGAFTLRNFILMMRKHEVLASHMQVECRSEQFHAHGAALDVPSRPPFTPGGRPEHRAILRHTGLPQREIRNRFLRIIVAAYAFANSHLFEV